MVVRNQGRNRSRMDNHVWLGLLGMGLAAAALALARPVLRQGAQQAIGNAVTRMMKDPYQENLWEAVSAARRPGPQVIVETNLRAQEGIAIERPLGSPRTWPDLNNLVFDFAQLTRPPAEHDAPVDTKIVLGPRARKPLHLDTPIIVSGMAYGAALSAATKVAIARGTALVGTATNVGEGIVLPLERHAARHLIMQFHRATWGKEPDMLRRADMIEIHFGQGASGGVGSIVQTARNDPELRAQLGIHPGQQPVIYSGHPELRDGTRLEELVERLRRLTDGVPIGVKLAPGKDLENDLQICVDAGVDVIAIDGAQAATKGSPPILQDDFGVPTLHAVLRAVRFLEESKHKDKVSLIVGGGLYTPGDFLKVLALGADAVYIGSIALFALSHDQVFKSLPWEPPTQVVFYGGHQADQLDVDEAADRLAKFLRSCTQEMAVGMRALGKTSLTEVSKEDLMALDPTTAEICGVVPSFRSRKRTLPRS